MTPIHKLASHWGCRAAALAAALLLPLALPASAHRIEKRFTVDGRPVVIVRNAHGRIDVKSWKRMEVVVVGTHTSEKNEVESKQIDNRIEVNTRLKGQNLTPAEMEANYEITVPEETELQIQTGSGLVIVERVYGDMTFDTVAADVQLQEVYGFLMVKTIGGSLICTRCAGRLSVTSISGNIQLFQPQLDFARVQTTSGNILFDGELRRGSYNLKNYSGLIEIRFSETDSFDLNASTVLGSIENLATLKPDPRGARRQSPRASNAFIGTFNEGHARIELSTYNGKIRIRPRD
jgi:DUF4097 and DUF4098 domain-containing protein YvlB